MIIALYCRVSTVEQKKFGLSIELQKKKLLEYCSENNLTNHKFYIDEGKSGGFIKKRPAMIELINHIKGDSIEKILVTKLDRFSRNLKEFLDTMAIIQNKGCGFISLTDAINTNTAQGRFHLNVLMSMYQLERELAKQRTEEVQFDLVECGKLVTKLPFGYKPVRKDVDGEIKIVEWVIDKKEAEKIGLIFQAYNGGTTKTELAKKFNTYKQNISRILHNKVYIGIMTYKKTEYKGNFEPIFKSSEDKQLFNQVQERLIKEQQEYNSKLLYVKMGVKNATNK